MLERTAGCLESGTLRRLIPGSKKALKSQRMLHSSFWIHGAGELELPPLWTMLMSEYDVTDDETKETKGSCITTATSGFLLDFLYPAGTFTFLRQLSGWPMIRQGSKHAKPPSARFGQRLFSSGSTVTNRNISGSESLLSAGGSINPEAEYASSDIERNYETNTWDTTGDELPRPAFAIRQLRELMKADGPKIDHEEVWRQYQNLPPDHQGSIASKVLKYLSNSNRRIDVRRVTSLLDSIHPQDRDDDTWRCGIKAVIAADNLAEAVIYQRMALQHKNLSCSAILIAAQLQVRDWVGARDTYSAHQMETSNQENDQDKPSSPPFIDPLIQEASADMPEFATIVLDLAKQTVDYRSLNSETESAITLKDFAVLLARQALFPLSGTWQPKIFNALMTIIQVWKADPPRLYQYTHRKLYRMEYFGLLIDNYKEYRKQHPEKISRSVIRRMLGVFCKRHNVLGLQMVLDDSFSSLGGPEKSTYKMCMMEFAWQGNAKAVEALFEQYTDRFCRVDKHIRLQTADEVAPLLNAYAKRGDLHRVISIFDQIENKYEMKPSLMCWNILINAYGNVRDIDGAFQRFEQLLVSEQKPDQWTFGTLMGICVIRGDADRTMEVFQLAMDMKVPISTAMVDCLVLAKIQDGKLDQAHELCEKALQMKLECPPSNKTPVTRMWNQLLNAYGMRRDIQGTNGVLQKMSEFGVEYDPYTYSALMQSLAMVKQANVAWKLLTDVMPKAGILPNNFHYAIVMGGFLATGQLEALFKTYDRMLVRNVRPNGSTSITALKASFILDQRRLDSLSSLEQSSPDESSSDESAKRSRFELAEEYFEQVIRDLDPYEWISSTPRKGMGRDPVDIAYSTAIFRYMIFVYGTNRMMDRVKQLYAQYIESLPEDRKDQIPPIGMLEALIKANLEDENYVGVEQCWQLAFEAAKKSGSGIRADSSPYRVLPYHKSSLSVVLTSYIHAMARQDKFDELRQVLTQVEDAGFVLDNKNWNVYIQHLVRGRYIQQAFEFSETNLMDNWAGWRRQRWKSDQRTALPWEFRLMRRNKGFLYPFYYTLLCLARAWLDANEMAGENEKLKGIVRDLEAKCPKLVGAVETMPRTLDPVEMHVMTGEGW